MRKLLIIAAVVLAFSSCRKTSDYVPYLGERSQLTYSTYAEQFNVIWSNIDRGYVFWDVDKTDWDEVYKKYMPEFESFDKRVEAGEHIATSELQKLYEKVMGNFIDHHMNIKVKNLFSDGSDDGMVSFSPSDNEVPKRDYYYKGHDEMTQEIVLCNINLEPETSAYSIIDTKIALLEQDGLILYYILFGLPDGRVIPYLWQTGYQMTMILPHVENPESPYYEAAQLIDTWLTVATETPKEQLAGIILDNRCNSGGYMNDINFVLSSFVKSDFSVLSTRYKEGSGRLEHSVWTPMVIKTKEYSRDLAAENIPYVVLSNIYSISMGEITSYHISKMPTGYMIGERTYGATGPLNPADYVSITYGGSFGDIEKDGHFVYTSTNETKTIDGIVPEGIGFTPDKELLTKEVGVKAQLDAALDYIINYNK
jgi:hypothetical protein